MSGFAVCLIDDALLRIERADKFFTEYQIRTNLDNLAPDGAEEHEINLKNFINSMLQDPSIVLHGYTNPTTYNKNIGKQPAFDVVIYDWEYGPTGAAVNSKEQLEKMIEESHCFVYIYSHMDNKSLNDEIDEIKAKYPHRVIGFLQKGDANSAKQLSQEVNRLKDSNFSAKFAKELRVNASKSVEKILVKLAHLDIEKFHQMMGTNNEEKKKDIVEFITEKFKNNMMEMDFLADETGGMPPVELNVAAMQPTAAVIQEPSIKVLWHYRMYSTIGDKRVRKGDIYKKNAGNEYILIMTPNCQLVSYHDNKTFGVFNYVRMVSTQSLRDTVDGLVSPTNDAGQNVNALKTKIANSLIAPISEKESAPFVLPYAVREEEYASLVLFPKMYGYEVIQVKNQKKYLEKSELTGYEYITSLSEPFLTELTNEIYDKLQGNGVPDYTKPVKEEIKNIIDQCMNRS